MRRALAAPGLAAQSWGTVPVLIAGLGVLLLVRIVALALNGTDLFFDEAQYWTWAQEPAFGYYSKPPLIAALIGATDTLCGDSTFCVRLSAPLLHTATAGLIFLVARRLYDAEVGLWSALVFATLPGVSLSSGIISTDVPLLAAWALALLGLVGLVDDPDGWWPALALGLGIGLGLNAKYAMAFFVGSLGVWLIVDRAARALLRDPRLWVGLALGVLAIVPNLAWNMAHKFATFAHTADNAKWGGSLLHPGKGLEFVAAQAAVFGPVLLVALVLVIHRAWLGRLGRVERMLLCFTLPVLAVITGQAFVSRAHANWAATAYVAGAILVTAVLVRSGREGWLKGSLGLHVAIMLALAFGVAAAGRFSLPGVGDPFERMLGWQEIAQRTQGVLAEARASGKPFDAVVTDERALTAELLYYMRNSKTPVLAFQAGPRPLDHYEMTRPLRAGDKQRVLLVGMRPASRDEISPSFARAQLVREEAVPAGRGRPRNVRFVALEGQKRGD